MKKALAFIIPLGVGLMLYSFSPVEYERKESPYGDYTAVAYHHRYKSWFPAFPGGSGDKSGWITMEKNKERMETHHVEMLSFIHEIGWKPDSAEIRLVAEWDLTRKEG